jgi:Tol biopolymer transport system component
MSKRTSVCAAAVALLPVVLGGGYGGAAASTPCRPAVSSRTERVDVSTTGEQANGMTFRGPMSASGRFVAFSSYATNLVPNDYNGVEDVFVRDLLLKQTTRVSVTSTGEEANGSSYLPLISGDGRLVAFRSVATNLTLANGHRVESYFVHDRLTGLTERVPLGPTGDNPARVETGSRRAVCDRWCANAISGDGSALVLTSNASRLVRGDRNRARDVFVLARGRTIRVTVGPKGEGNGASEGSSISADGRVVAFRSFASNLVRGDTNRRPDVFVRDWVTGVTQRVNVSSSGEQANSETFRGNLSADGRFVGFRSRASNLVPGDTNDALDVFVHDRLTRKTTRISVAGNGAQASGRGFSKHVRHVLFMSRPFLSPHGRYAAFTSRARDLVRDDRNGHADVFLHDLKTGQTVRMSVPDGRGQSISDSRVTGISADGRIVGFMSFGSNLVPGDTNGVRDYFVRVRGVEASC